MDPDRRIPKPWIPTLPPFHRNTVRLGRHKFTRSIVYDLTVADGCGERWTRLVVTDDGQLVEYAKNGYEYGSLGRASAYARFEIDAHTRHRSGGRVTAFKLVLVKRRPPPREDQHTAEILGYWVGNPAELVVWVGRVNTYLTTTHFGSSSEGSRP